MALVFSVPCDFDSVRVAIVEVVRRMRWSHTYRYDELIPGWCEWDILDSLSQESRGTIHLRKLGDSVRLSIPAVRDMANILVPMLQSLDIPLRPREQLLPLGGHQVSTRAPQDQRGGRPGLDREELVYRLKAAHRARELRRRGMTWREAAQEIRWNYGSGLSGIKLLQDAERRLRRLEQNDPDGLLTTI